MRRRDEVAAFWDDAVARFFKGEQRHRDDPALAAWFRGYRGGGRGAVTAEAFPEPYIGPLASSAGEPRVVALGLNPGEADLRFQGRGGIFAREIADHGAFSRWAVSEPYLREPWRSAHRRNVYHENLRTFARQWTGQTDVQSSDVLVMELFPWHSDKVTAKMSPAPQLVGEFIWQPIAEIDVPVVFGFGAPWRRIAATLGLPEVEVRAEFTSAARNLRVFALPSGQQLAVVWQSGYAGPPGGPDVALLKAALAGHPSPPARTRTHPVPSTPEPVADPATTVSSAHTPLRPMTPRDVPAATTPAGKGDYQRYWSQLVDRLRRELPGVQTGTPQNNDLPLYAPLTKAKFKFNFPTEGLRLELLLTSTDRAENLRHLRLLCEHLDALQAAFGPAPSLVPDDLEQRQRTQARVAVYLPGARVTETARWQEFQDWCVDVLRRFRDALGAVPEIRARW